jgi:DNA primase
MLGSSSLIHADALPLFKGREVLILAHPDNAGETAAKKWCKQLRKVKAEPRVKKLSGGDLNDLVKRDGSECVANGLLQ